MYVFKWLAKILEIYYIILDFTSVVNEVASECISMLLHDMMLKLKLLNSTINVF